VSRKRRRRDEYVRGVFREAFGWKLYDGQREDVRSNAIVIEILPADARDPAGGQGGR